MMTVLICVKNKIQTLDACLNAIYRLQWPQKEKKIFIVDGYSDDGSYEKLLRHRREHTFAFYRIGGGYSKQLNFALDKIQTKYIALTDADCVVSNNWLLELLKGFKKGGVVATAGFCGTPKKINILSRIIGRELEARFKKFPRYLHRAPTMNLCFKTRVARQVRFDENIKVAVETDFGYRLLKYGKIKYLPRAIVWHYHRADFKSYFSQQRSQARGTFFVYRKHKDKVMGDEISNFTMLLQIPLLGIILLLVIIGLFINSIWYLTLICVGVLFAIYLKDIFRIKPSVSELPVNFAMLLTRNVAWLFGMFEALIMYTLWRKMLY